MREILFRGKRVDNSEWVYGNYLKHQRTGKIFIKPYGLNCIHSQEVIPETVTEFTSAYDNGHNIQRYPLAEISTPHGRLIDADELIRCIAHAFGDKDIVKLVANIIERQPTIIEAEV